MTPTVPDLPRSLATRLRAWLAAGHNRRRAAQQSRACLQLLDLLPLPVAVCSAGRARINAAMAQLLRVQRGDALELPWDWQHFIAESDWPDWSAAVQRVQQTGLAQWLHARVRAEGLQRLRAEDAERAPAGDAQRELLVQLAPIDAFDAAGAALAVVLHVAEDAAAQQANLQLRQLLATAETEKWRFGQAVHDELGQRLSGIAYFAKALERKLQAERRAEADDAGWLTRLANESMSAARALAQGLMPVGSDDAGALEVALVTLCRNTGKMFDTRCTLDADPAFVAGSVAQANHLYHAIQELMSNGIKHGGARNVQVRLEVQPRGRRVSVYNDGLGLSAAAPDPQVRRGMGLYGVRSRVAHLGGQFTLADVAAGGVLATIELPALAENGGDA